MDSHDRFPAGQQPLSKPGLSEKKDEREEREKYRLINEHNRLTFAVREKEAKLRDLQEAERFMNLQAANDKCEATYEERILQLESDLEKIKLMVSHAGQNQILYKEIQEVLLKEVRDGFGRLDQRELTAAIGQAEVERLTKQLQSAEAATNSIQDNMVQLVNETKERHRQMDSELCELSAEEKVLKKKLEPLWRLCTMGKQEGGEKQEQQQEEQEEEEAQSTSVRDDQCCDPQPNMNLIEEMEALKEALGCVDVQDLVNKVASQQAIKEHLLVQMNQYEEEIRQESQTLANLETQYAELKFRAKPAPTRLDRLKEETQARLNQEVDRVKRLQAELKQSQDLMGTIERAINNLYFRTSAYVPAEDRPSASSADHTEKLRVISTGFAILRERASVQKPEMSNLDQEKVYSLLEKINTTDPRNNKRPATPIDTPQLSDDEDAYAPSREDIKRNSIRLIESMQSKKSSTRAKSKQ